MLVLNNNRISTIQDIEALLKMPALKYLSLMDNPICKEKHYRMQILACLPKLRALDFKRVTPLEVQLALKMFPKRLESIKGTSNKRQHDSAEDDEIPAGKKLTPAESEKIKEAIKNASSLEEISRLERILQSGHIPKWKL